MAASGARAAAEGPTWRGEWGLAGRSAAFERGCGIGGGCIGCASGCREDRRAPLAAPRPHARTPSRPHARTAYTSPVTPGTLRTLLHHLVDYAGLFPPAALDMHAAVHEYALHRAGEHAWMLGHFVLPVSRLAEFEAAAGTLGPSAIGDVWQLSVLPSADLDATLAAIAGFNARNRVTPGRSAVADTLELKLEALPDIEATLAKVPPGLTPYVELPIDDDLAPRLAAISRAGARAKVRTGGVTAGAFPPSHALARFIQSCADAGVPFKATAGLHHPLRGDYRLTYEPGAPHGMMFGFLNVFLAAAFARTGLTLKELALLLEEKDATTFEFTETAASWRGRTVSRTGISAVRHHVALSFGSCSFQEPVDDLRSLGLL